MQQDLVSIIVPMYNAEKYIENCLNSLLNQTYKNIEIILIDDGSTDNTLNIIDTLKKNEENIRVIRQKNCGVSHARNTGIKNSTGKYIFFIDADDWIDNETIETLVKIIKKENVDIVKCNFVREKENKRIDNNILILENICNTSIPKSKYIDKLYPQLSNTNFFNVVWGQLINKDIIKELFDEQMAFGEDYLFNIQLYYNSNSIYIYNYTLYHYRANFNGINRNKNIKICKMKCDNLMYVYDMVINLLKYNVNQVDLKKIQLKFLEDILNKFFDVLSSESYFKEKVKFIEDILCSDNYSKCIEGLEVTDICLRKSKNVILLKQMIKKRKYKIIIISVFLYIPLKRIFRK